MEPSPKFEPHPQTAPGDFYVENGQCLACGIPHAIAPDLMGWADQQSLHCIWKKQPKTQAEIERAIAVLDAQELGCHRYAGTDPAILERVLSSYCDYPVQPAKSAAPPELLPKFALLNENPRLITRMWRTILRRTPRR
jgi:hypothetical protein